MALEHAGEAIAHLVRWRTDGDGAGDVRGAIEILRAGIDQVELARLDPAIGGLGDAVVDDGAVGAGAGDAVEAEILEQLVLAAEGGEAIRGLDLREAAAAGVTGEP